MNKISADNKTAKLGELLVQLDLLDNDVQAAPPIYDSGNDLIAVKSDVFKAVQIKTEGPNSASWTVPDDRLYHILALVKLDANVFHSRIYYLEKSNALAMGLSSIRASLSAEYQMPGSKSLFETS